MNELKPARLISDKMIMQRGEKGHIWGFDKPFAKVSVKLPKACVLQDAGSENEIYSCEASESGRFDIYTDELISGGPYEICISDDLGNSVSVKDVYIGDVFVMCGQSNMEFPMYRVFDTYPEAADEQGDDNLRTFKIIENREYTTPVIDNVSGTWEEPNPSNIRTYPAIGYFFGKELSKLSGCKVGMINASLGGSPIASWMSREMLEGEEDLLEITDKYADRDFYEAALKRNEEINVKWHSVLDEKDCGLKCNYDSICADEYDVITANWNKIALPQFFCDTQLNGFIGSIWLAKKFNVSKELLNKRKRVWFGTMFDADTFYINGHMVGTTGYCYPPRRYEIGEDVLRERENVAVIRLLVEKGNGRFTPGKKYGILFGNVKRTMKDGFEECLEGYDGFIDLSGEWRYCIGAESERIEDTDFLSWKPTALYNGMLAPVTNYPVKGFIWYQGESDAHTFERYKRLSIKQIEGYRKAWGKENLPYIYVQLPRFDALKYEGDYSSDKKGWSHIQEIQEELGEIHDTYMINAFETGEINDLHPQEKQPIGQMLAKIAKML